MKAFSIGLNVRLSGRNLQEYRQHIDMEVTFTRTGERRYRVSVAGSDLVPSYMEPAPGYDPELPHDMAHFIVENELGIQGGVFGQLAAGGDAGTFIPTDLEKRRKVARRGDRIAKASKTDALLSERLVYEVSKLRQGKQPDTSSLGKISIEDLKRACRVFEEASATWSRLAVGESMTLVWRGGAGHKARRARR